MKIGPVEVRREVVEAIRRIYVNQPWTTAAGLATRFGLPGRVGCAIIAGGWVGGSDVGTAAVARNLADERRAKRDQIEQRLAGRGRLRLEPALEGKKWRAFVQDEPPRGRRRTYLGRRAERLAEHIDEYEPLVGATKRAANARLREKRIQEAKKKEDGP